MKKFEFKNSYSDESIVGRIVGGVISTTIPLAIIGLIGWGARACVQSDIEETRRYNSAIVQLEKGTENRYTPKTGVPRDLICRSSTYCNRTNLTFEGTSTRDGKDYAIIRERCYVQRGGNSNLREVQEGTTSTIIMNCGYGHPLQVTAKEVEDGTATLETRIK